MSMGGLMQVAPFVQLVDTIKGDWADVSTRVQTPSASLARLHLETITVIRALHGNYALSHHDLHRGGAIARGQRERQKQAASVRLLALESHLQGLQHHVTQLHAFSELMNKAAQSVDSELTYVKNHIRQLKRQGASQAGSSWVQANKPSTPAPVVSRKAQSTEGSAIGSTHKRSCPAGDVEGSNATSTKRRRSEMPPTSATSLLPESFAKTRSSDAPVTTRSSGKERVVDHAQQPSDEDTMALESRERKIQQRRRSGPDVALVETAAPPGPDSEDEDEDEGEDGVVYEYGYTRRGKVEDSVVEDNAPMTTQIILEGHEKFEMTDYFAKWDVLPLEQARKEKRSDVGHEYAAEADSASKDDDEDEDDDDDDDDVLPHLSLKGQLPDSPSGASVGAVQTAACMPRLSTDPRSSRSCSV